MRREEAEPGTPPLKRHSALQPLSREHMSGLIQARNLRRAAAGDSALRARAVEDFIRVWRAEIRQHFDDEERLLLPLTDSAELRDRLLEEHRELRELAERLEREPGRIAAEPQVIDRLGTILDAHIRWEERVFFEAVQRTHPEALARLVPEAGRIEDSRPGARPRLRLDPPGPGEG